MDGQLIICEGDNNRVQVMGASDGRHITKVGTHGSGEGQLKCPDSILMQDGNIYVSDLFNHRICIFRIN